MKTPDILNHDHAGNADLKSLPPVDLTFKISEGEVWEKLAPVILMPGREPRAIRRLTVQPWARVSAAAILILLVASVSFTRLYTITVKSPVGQRVIVELPDDSKVEMNAVSVLKYKPLWWRFRREVLFEGEAFFKVHEGGKFMVKSNRGHAMVIGTSFNIFSREGVYKVTCLTGRVRVVSAASGHSLDILPNEQASVNIDGTLMLSRVEVNTDVAPWMNDMFFFTGEPLPLVFDEIERQFGIEIHATEDFSDLLYTGNFTRHLSVEEVLKMVCRPYALNFKTVNGIHVIYKE